MQLVPYLTEAHVRVGFTAADKTVAIAGLSQLLAAPGGPSESALTADRINTLLWERERLATTGVGSGVAIPHARADIGDFRLAIAVSEGGVPFDAVDKQPVHILVALLAPEGRPAAQLKMLARISRTLGRDEAREQLTAASSEADVLRALHTLETAT